MKKILFLLLPLFFIACGGNSTKEENSIIEDNINVIENNNPYNQLEDLDNNSTLVPPSF